MLSSITLSVSTLQKGVQSQQSQKKKKKKKREQYELLRSTQAPEPGRGSRQTEQQQPWHMAHIHCRLPRHRAP